MNYQPRHASPPTDLTKDALNRAARTLYQNVGIDVLVAVAAILIPIVTNSQAFSDFNLKLIAFSLTKTVLLTVFAFVMRRYLDRSTVPTPLPPAEPGLPDEDTPEPTPTPEPTAKEST